MKLTNALLTVLPATLAAASHPFSGMALRSASPIHFLSIAARGQSIYVGGKTATYCPDVVEPNCPPGKVTAFNYGGHGLAMNVAVPGGQQVYVTRKGRVGFTAPHSAAIPAGATTGGWNYEPDVFGGDEPFADRLTHKGGLVACPTKKDGEYQVFAQVPGFDRKHCLGFDFLASNRTGTAAWEYT